MPNKMTPYKLDCRTHGSFYLTFQEYTKQLASDADWECPKGGNSCEEVVFDEENYQQVMGVRRNLFNSIPEKL